MKRKGVILTPRDKYLLTPSFDLVLLRSNEDQRIQ